MTTEELERMNWTRTETTVKVIKWTKKRALQAENQGVGKDGVNEDIDDNET